MSAAIMLDDLLLAYAAGRLPEPLGVAVASHLALKPESRRRYAMMETIGGVLLDTLPEVTLGEDALARTLGRLDEPKDTVQAAPTPVDADMPPPLRAYLPRGLEGLRWRRLGPLAEARLPIASHSLTTRLLRVQGGHRLPKHTHKGLEVTLVLKGAYRDAYDRYAKGDLEIADEAIDHRPIAERGEACLCLIVSAAPIKLTGRLRFLNPLLGV